MEEYKNCKIFAETVEATAMEQIKKLADFPAYENNKIRIMPDTHAGAGCTIGTTMTITDKITPNLVGVDIGCLDMDTEILTRDGWVKISQYNYQDILVYNKNTEEAFFDTPYAYIKKRCDKFYHFYSKHGLDQMLSAEHKMLVWRGTKGKGYIQEIELAEDVFRFHNNTVKSNRAIKTTFHYNIPPKDISNEMIRVLVMICADGRVKYVNQAPNTYVELHFKKARKIERCRRLLTDAGIKHTESSSKDGSMYIGLLLPMEISKEKKYLHCLLYDLNADQLGVMIEELYYWDGTRDEDRRHFYYSTSNKQDADFVQFALATRGIRGGIQCTLPKGNSNFNYCVYQTTNEYVGFPAHKFNEVESKDGYKYCFTTSTGFFIIRRNDKVSITGNCGMTVCPLLERIEDFSSFDNAVRKYIPSGFAIHDTPVEHTEDWVDKLGELKCASAIDIDYMVRSIGSLGGGNHFIEVDEDEQGKQYLVIHSGSRNLGVKIAKYYQDLAIKGNKKTDIQELINKLRAEGRESEIQSAISNHKTTEIPKELAFVEGWLFDDYLHDMRIAQAYAYTNRIAMVNRLVIYAGVSISTKDVFTTIHNYIDLDNMILRKGAVSAQKGERLIIPINMRDGSLICIGKGNEDWNCSAPHGAGRLMSRKAAKEKLSMEDYKQSMSGIFTTSVDESTKDEAPMAYKPMDEIIRCIEPTCEIEKIIKPVYNFKAGGE